jgi:Pyridoxamine 5'-phosphate oxidase
VSVDLLALPGLFDGVIPPVVATASGAGEPNVTHLSQLYLVDSTHVALSNQFFGKTTANVAERPEASVLVTDSHSYDTYRMELRFMRTEQAGPVFELLRRSIDAIGTLMHMEEVFALRGADIYEVLSCEQVS